MRYIVDSIEEGIALLERDDMTFLEIGVGELPEGTKQHDCLICEDGIWSVDRERTESRKRMLEQKTKSLFRKNRR